MIDLAALAVGGARFGPIWTYLGTELNVNLLVFEAGGGVAEHVNDEVEVLIVGVAGEGFVEVDGQREPLQAGQAIVIPRGARRAIRSGSDRLAYLTCHRRRALLWPVGVPRPAPRASAGGEHTA